MPFRGVLRLVAFVALYGVLYFLLASFWSSGLAHWIIDVATVRPAACLARLLSGDPAIVAAGSRIQSPEASINVLFGCEGSDALLLLVAALLAAPARWHARVIGVAFGSACVFAVNQARVLALFFAFRSHRAWFGLIHGLLGPMLVVFAVTVFFLAWLRWADADARAAQPA